jgi:cytochrome P450
MTVSHAPRTDFDPHHPGLAPVQHEVLAEMLERCPVAWSDAHGGFWTIAKFDDVVASARDHTVFSVAQGVMVPSTGASTPVPPVQVDPPEHAGYRKVLHPHFNPKAVLDYQDLIRAAVATLLAPVLPEGRADLVQCLAKPLPTLVLAGVLGLDPDEGLRTLELIDAYLDVYGKSPDQRRLAAIEFERFISDLIAERQASSGDGDVLTQIVHAQIDGAPIEPDMLLGMVHVLISAGHETTINGLANVLFHIATVPRLREQLLADRGLIPAVVAESLRVESPITCMARTVMADTTVRNVGMQTGDKALLLYGAANLDPDRFTDPDEFRLGRGVPHIAFGSGPHRCVGEHLALMELRIAVDYVLNTMPDFHIAPDSEVVWGSGAVRRGVRVLPVEFTPLEREHAVAAGADE